MTDLNHKRVRELFDYDPVTGDLRWISPKSCNVKADGLAGYIGNGYRHVTVEGKAIWPIDWHGFG